MVMAGGEGNPVFDTVHPTVSISLSDLVAALIYPQELAKITTNVASPEKLEEFKRSAAVNSYKLAKLFLEARKTG